MAKGVEANTQQQPPTPYPTALMLWFLLAQVTSILLCPRSSTQPVEPTDQQQQRQCPELVTDAEPQAPP